MGADIPNRGPELLGVNIAFLVAAVLAYGLRCYVRIGMVKGFKTDDWLMGLALVFFILYDTASIYGVHWGTGRHYTDLSVDQIANARRGWYFCYLFYSSSMVCSKISIGFFLLRIAIQKSHTFIIHSVMAVSFVSSLAFFCVTLFQCTPVSYFWNTRQEGTCIDSTIIIALAYVYSAFSIITDFTFALLPTFLIMNLQLKRRTKLALVPLLTMGCIASSAVVVRLPFILQIGSPDFLWATLDTAIWSTIEQGLAITAGSLATIRPLFTILLQKCGLITTVKQPTPIFGGNHVSTKNRIVGGHRSARSRDELDTYQLTTRGGDEECGNFDFQKEDPLSSFPRSPTWHQSTFDRVKRGSLAKGKKDADVMMEEDASEKSLKDNSDTASMNEDRGMHIMVSKSFVVSDAERGSFVDPNMER